ncbi:histidine phosphatase superfamily [Lophiotrema nucula]|uniref:Histidine phosphatase superfamily n=1 Tax=Lophiotrema nucula TaxID=690887 RepID=A0A6A5ZBM0_9PLEO|nr:histidine phosphatase superfamily [Lophiotrema nucula]
MAPKRIHLIRHAQGYHNLSIESHSLPDPELTTEGEQQCLRLSSKIDDIQAIDCIVASPLKRTLWTALVTFRAVLQSRPGMRVIALPELQETSTLPCDIGTDVEQLKQEMEGHPIDWTYVQSDWNSKSTGRYVPRADIVTSRAQMSRRFLQCREEQQVAVVTHGSFLHFLSEDWMEYAKFGGTGWANTEMRTYTFDLSSVDAINNASMRETPSSIARRFNSLRPLTIDEQLQLQAVAHQLWAKYGFITLPDESRAKELEDNSRSTCKGDGDLQGIQARPQHEKTSADGKGILMV